MDVNNEKESDNIEKTWKKIHLFYIIALHSYMIFFLNMNANLLIEQL